MGKKLLFGLMLLAGGAGAAAQTVASLADLSLEELSSIVVTSVSRRSEPLSQAPASVYVITGQDIRRAGVTSLPEALRLAPNLIVARVNAWDYAITSSRGFLSTLGTKLLVMVDGRNIYTPLFAGVTWDAHDVMLEDVERIEVISGPGGTTWGSNAVIGVINVITKSAAETQGTLASGYAGNREDGIAARHGGQAGKARWRAYAKHFDRDNFERGDGVALRDGGRRNQGGFRADWQIERDALTLQGDAYEGQREEAFGRRELSGVNLLGRWQRAFAGGASAEVQAYFDRSERDQARTFIETLEIADLEARYTGAPAGRHRFTVGGGYRRAYDRTGSDFGPVMVPSNRELQWLNVFAQDEITLRPDLVLTLGLRAEENSYTGWESMPSARLAWLAAPRHLIWTALSRAVRSPSRIDTDFATTSAAGPVPLGPNFVSEVADVLELGYRAQPTARLSYSFTGFAHEYDRLRSLETRPGQPAQIENRVDGSTRGVEGWGALQVTERWRLSGGFVLLDQDLEREPGSTANAVGEARDPSHQWMLRSSHNLGAHLDLDLQVRRMGALPSPNVPAYTALDARLAWRATRALEIALAGQNLTDPSHPEFGAAPARAEIPRTILLSARLALP
jgi:iron complex outermembrane receptor protein